MLLIVLVVVTTCDSVPPKQNQTPAPPFDTSQCTARSSTPITLTMYYGSEKQKWIADVVNDFNSRKIAACDGPITIKATPIGSGESMQEMLAGQIQPDIWSPAGRIWLNLLNARWRATPGNTSDLVQTSSIDSPSLVLSPVVIAMYQSRAQALGWPNKSLGWSDIEALSTASQGWAAYGHPEWGMFRFAHTGPRSSNSGLDAVMMEFYAPLDKQSGLSLADVNNPQAQSFVAGIENSVQSYGGGDPKQDSTGFIAETMCKQGPNAFSAAVLYESLVVEMNEGKLSPPCPEHVVALYPPTFYSDHPFAIPLRVSPAHRTSALAFRNFLLARAQQQKALLYGFRPTDLSIPVTTVLNRKNGVDPTLPKTTLQLPTLDVVQAIQDAWGQLRPRVAVMLLLDTSGSMSWSVGVTPKISAAKQGLDLFLGCLSATDWAGLTTFSTDMQVLFPVAPLGPTRQQMFQKIDGITAGGATRLYDSIFDQVQALSNLSTNYHKALVVLTDGVDTASQRSLDDLIKQIKPLRVPVYAIAYGDSSYMDPAGLSQIAQATGGQEHGSTPQDIQQVYNQISQSLVGC